MVDLDGNLFVDLLVYLDLILELLLVLEEVGVDGFEVVLLVLKLGEVFKDGGVLFLELFLNIAKIDFFYRRWFRFLNPFICESSNEFS